MLRKFLRTTLLAAASCLAFSSLTQAQQLRAPLEPLLETPAPIQSLVAPDLEGDLSPTGPTVTFQMYPNPTYGVVVNIIAPQSGLMMLQVKPMFGPSAGQTLGYIYQGAYVGGAVHQHLFDPSVIKPGTYLIAGSVGGVTYLKYLNVTY